MDKEPAKFYGDTRNIQRAIGVQGQFVLDAVRDDEGIKVVHDVGWYLRQNQNVYNFVQADFTPAGAGVGSTNSQVNVGCFLLGFHLAFNTEADLAQLYGAAAGFLYPSSDIPLTGPLGTNQMQPVTTWVKGAVGSATDGVTFGNVAGQTVSYMRPYQMAGPFPIWLPAGSQLIFRYRSLGAFAGAMHYQAVTVTTAPSGVTGVSNTERMEPIR